MTLSLRPATDADYLFAFELKKASEQDVITQLFGWDEKLQWELHRQEWRSGLPTIICLGEQAIGTFRLHRHGERLHFSRFFILPAFQNQGFGSEILSLIIERSTQQQRACLLCCIHGNRAIELYQRFGFTTYRTDTQFVYMKFQPKTH